MINRERPLSRMTIRWVSIGLAITLVVSFGISGLGQRQPDWAPIVEELHGQPSGERLAELVHQALDLFAGDAAERLLAVLSPAHTILYCAGTGCLGLVMITPPSELFAGQTPMGASRAYNQDQVVGFIGTFGNTLVPGLEGFFLLRSNPDGSIALLDNAGEQVASLVAAHLLQTGATPLPIPRPEDGSTLLPRQVLEMQIEIDELTVAASAESRSPIEITIGSTGRDGLFSGVILCGAIPITVP